MIYRHTQFWIVEGRPLRTPPKEKDSKTAWYIFLAVVAVVHYLFNPLLVEKRAPHAEHRQAVNQAAFRAE